MGNSNVVCYDDLINDHYQALLDDNKHWFPDFVWDSSEAEIDMTEEALLLEEWTVDDDDTDYTVLSEDCTYDCNW